MELPELDVSVNRLTWRSDIEVRIQQTLRLGGFVREGSKDGERTKWNRAIHLYTRVQEDRSTSAQVKTSCEKHEPGITT